VCGEQTFKAHRLIICSQSPVFAALCAESKVRASQIIARGDLIHRLSPQFSGLINLTSHNLEAVTKMIEFLYTGSYNTVDISPTYSLHTHTQVHGLAVKYQIYGLVILSATNFASALRHVRDLEVYFQSVRDVYSLPVVQDPPYPSLDAQNQPGNHPPGHHLRAEVIDAALVELSKILASPLVLARFQEICTEVPQFHADFLNVMLEMKIETENALGDGEKDGGMQPLCDSCGPREEGYEIELRCSGCGKECLHSFH
jgi:hypothetical protein